MISYKICDFIYMYFHFFSVEYDLMVFNNSLAYGSFWKCYLTGSINSLITVVRDFLMSVGCISPLI